LRFTIRVTCGSTEVRESTLSTSPCHLSESASRRAHLAIGTSLTYPRSMARRRRKIPSLLLTAGAMGTKLCLVGDVGRGEAGHCRTRTQSDCPSLFKPGVEKTCEPLLANGEPAIAVYVPVLGSYHRAVTGPVNFARLTVKALPAGS
jgi:hypothetical protein